MLKPIKLQTHQKYPDIKSCVHTVHKSKVILFYFFFLSSPQSTFIWEHRSTPLHIYLYLDPHKYIIFTKNSLYYSRETHCGVGEMNVSEGTGVCCVC